MALQISDVLDIGIVRAGVGVYFYNEPISSHPGRVTLGTYASKPRDLVSFQGQIQEFFRRGCTRLLLYFNTNKPDSFFFAEYQLY